MKILHVIDSFAQGGAETLLLNTIDQLPDHEHIVVAIIDKFEFDSSVRSKFIYYTLDCTSKIHWPGAVIKLRRLIRRHKPDLVHAHLHIAGVLTKLACPASIPLFYSIHSIYSSSQFKTNVIARRLERWSARSYHHLIGVSKTALADYVKQVPPSGTHDVLYNFVADKFFEIKPTSGYVPGQPLHCVSIGNLKYQKNYTYTLQNFARLKELPVFLDIYGTGPEENKIKNYLDEHSLKNVNLKDREANIEKILPLYNLYIINSSMEGFGIAPLEAMAARLPVIVSDIPTFQEIIGDAGITVKLGVEDNLASVLKKIFNGEILLNDYVAAGYKRAKEISHSKKYISDLRIIYGKYV